MVDLLQPLVVTPQACPFVALDGDRDQRLPVPDPMHRCFAEATPKARSMGHQASFCLTASFTGCPIFLDWASRVAADVVATGPAGAGASAGTSAGAASVAASAGTASVAGGTAGVASGAARSSGPPPATAPADPAPRPSAGAPPWVAEAMPPPTDSMEVASRRTARVAIDTGPGPGAGIAPATDVTVLATAATAHPYPEFAPAAAGGAPHAPDAAAPMDPDGDTAAELAASMARSDLIVDGDGAADAEPRASTTADDDGTDSPPWSRGRPRVPVDAGAPSSLGPQTRPGAKPSGPREWEGGRRFEAYAARAGSRRPGRPVLIAAGAGLVAVALLVVFLLPSLFRGGGAAPTADPSPPANGVTATAKPRSTAEAPGATPRPERTPGSYKIKRGDTLSSIGRKFGVTVDQLICANNIRNPNTVSTGTTLVIPVESYECPKPTKKPKKTPTG